MLDLMRHTDPQRVQWQGTALLRRMNGVEATIKEFRSLAPVYYASAGVAELASTCSVLLSWGIPNLRAYIPNTYTGRLVLVSHGSGPWTGRGFAKTHGQELVAVALAALKPIPERWRDRVTILRNGVDPERVQPKLTAAQQRRRWKIPRDAPVVGFLGRLSREKNPLGWVRGFAALPSSWYGVMLGSGADEAEIRAEADRLGVLDRLRLPSFTSDVGSALAAFSVLLMPAHEEGYGLALVEAMLAGCPVVSTPVGIIPECPGCVEEVELRADGEALAAAVLRARGGERVEQARSWALTHATAAEFGARWTEYLDR